MKLYAIRDWNVHYENHKTRILADLRYVYLPNHHDGETFTRIMEHPDGAAIYAGWILMLQVASKCKPRGTLVRSNGQPHDATSLSLKCRAPVRLLQTALDYLEKHTDWLIVTPALGTALEPAHEAAVGTATVSSTKEGKKEGMEGRKEHTASVMRRPKDLEECLAMASRIGLDESHARQWYVDAEAAEWRRGDGTLFDNWPRQMCIYRDKIRSVVRGLPQAVSATADIILRQNELKRIEERIKWLLNQKPWNSEDPQRNFRPEYLKLKERKGELLKLLGLPV